MRKDTAPDSPDSSRPASLDAAPNEPRTIVFFDHTATLGGGEIALFNLLLSLDQTRWRLLVVLGAEGPLAHKLRHASIETLILPLDARVAQARKDTLGSVKSVRARQALSSLGYVARLSVLLRRRGAFILHTNSLKADILGGLAGRLAQVPILWHVRDRITDEYLPPRTARLFRLLCRVLPHAIAANSRSTLESLQLPENEFTCVVHSGFRQSAQDPASQGDLARVVHDGFVEPSTEPPTAEGEAQVLEGTGGPLIGLVGRLSPWKGQDIFIRAAALVRERFPAARFQIIGSAMFGEAAYEAQVRALARELGLGGAVGDALEFTGFRSDVEASIARLDILVHASTMGEPFGQVVMEGMAAQKPVVATRGGGVPEIVAEGDTGLLVPMKDAPAMAEAIIWLLENPERAREMGLAGRRRVEEHFTIAQTAAKIEALYQSIASCQKVRARTSRTAKAGLALLLALLLLRKLRR